MDVLRALVLNMAFIVVLASFLELLLPAGSMRGFVRLVMGLFMILTVLNPLLNFIKADFVFPTFVAPALTSETGKAISKGEEIAKKNQDLALVEYKKGLAQQIKAVAEMKGSLIVESVAVILRGEDLGRPTGEIEKVTLAVRPGAGVKEPGESLVEPVAPVNINSQETIKKAEEQAEVALEPKLKSQLAGTLANFYNLTPSQVKILTPKVKEGR